MTAHNNSQKTVVVIGGGAAGFLGPSHALPPIQNAKLFFWKKHARCCPRSSSGGGRCNVTHYCFDPAILIQNYPRGGKELRGPFARFQPKDTIQWFESRGVPLKTESDGRMFPTTDSSETIIACLQQQMRTHGVELRLGAGVTNCVKEGDQFVLSLSQDETLRCDCLLVASGGASKVSEWLERFGHTLIPPVPSLFTFNIPNSPLHEFAGISVPQS